MADHYYSRNWQTQGPWPPVVPKVTITDHTFALPSHDQPDLTLLHRLPYEIRVLIYQQVVLELGHNLLHIYIPPPRTYCHMFEPYDPRICQPCICQDENYFQSPEWEGRNRTGSWGSTHLRCRDASRMTSQALPELKTIFALASSCRHLYHEVLPIFYSLITLHLVHLNTAHYFFNPISHRLQMLHTIHVSWMVFGTLDSSSMYFEFGDRAFATDIQRLNSVCKTLSTLPALQDLKIVFFHSFYTISEKQLLEPLLQIRNLRSFQVQLPWSKEDAVDPLDQEVPFEIERQPVPLYVDDIEENVDTGYVGLSPRRRRRHGIWPLLRIGSAAVFTTSRAAVKSLRKILSKAS